MLYDFPTWVIVLGLLFVALAANEAGFRYGLWHQGRESELSKTVSNTLKGSIFALVALLLAFSFSATSSRYDMRQRLVLDQANAIGTVYLRAGLLGEPASSNIRSTLRQYVDVRLEHFRAGYNTDASARLQLEIDGLMNTLWKEVERENSTDSEAVRTSLIVPAANEVIDLSSTRCMGQPQPPAGPGIGPAARQRSDFQPATGAFVGPGGTAAPRSVAGLQRGAGSGALRRTRFRPAQAGHDHDRSDAAD